MKKHLVSLTVFPLLFLTFPAFAVPLLQLDIEGGYYYTGGGPQYDNETILSTSDTFILYALMQEKKNKTSLADDYYISMALYPKVPETLLPSDVGSFDFEGLTISLKDMTYGNPGIPSHGVFTTYYYSYQFKFDQDDQTAIYNTQDNPGAQFSPGSGLYYAAFNVDTSELNRSFTIHFDLYNKKTYAPFSHDAQSDPPQIVSEPASLILLGLGLIGIKGLRRKIAR